MFAVVMVGIGAGCGQGAAPDDLGGAPVKYEPIARVELPARDAEPAAAEARLPARASVWEVRNRARLTVDLWDEMNRCARAPGFARAGWSAGGPCPDFLARLRAESEKGTNDAQVWTEAGCMPGDLLGAAADIGVDGVLDSRSLVPDEIAACRAFLKRP